MCYIDDADYTGPIRYHELDHIDRTYRARSGADNLSLKYLNRQAGIDDLSKVWAGSVGVMRWCAGIGGNVYGWFSLVFPSAL